MAALILVRIVSVSFIFHGCSSKSLAECISTLPNRNELIYKRIKGAVWVAPSDELVDNAQMTFNFTEEGHGNHGYNIYNYQKDDASYSYKKVSTFKF